MINPLQIYLASILKHEANTRDKYKMENVLFHVFINPNVIPNKMCSSTDFVWYMYRHVIYNLFLSWPGILRPLPGCLMLKSQHKFIENSWYLHILCWPTMYFYIQRNPIVKPGYIHTNNENHASIWLHCTNKHFNTIIDRYLLIFFR